MGVDTHLYIGMQWRLDDIFNTMRKVIAPELEIENRLTINPAMFTINFTYHEHKRMMHVHTDSPTPLGRAYLLSLGANDEAIEIMQKIADVLGGFLQPSDCNDKMEIIRGRLYEENGLYYFLRYALTHDNIEADDLKGLQVSIAAWNRQFKE